MGQTILLRRAFSPRPGKLLPHELLRSLASMGCEK